MRTWIRVVIPVNWIGILLFMYVLFHGILWSIEYEPKEGPSPTAGVLMLAAVAYGIYRVAAFHPVLRADYRTWLSRSPWTPAHPLPLGPIHPVPQDALIALLLTLLAVPEIAIRPAVFPLVMVAAYLSMLSVTYFFCSEYTLNYVMIFGLGLLLRFAQHLGVAWGIAGVLLVISVFGIRRCLSTYRTERNFPGSSVEQQPVWMPPSEWAADLKLHGNYSQGWPFDWLHPSPSADRIVAWHGTMVSLLAGWFAYAIISNVDIRMRHPLAIMGVAFACFFPSGIRLMTYMIGYRSPISFWGRILTWRWIIPGHDIILISPLLTMSLMPVAGAVLLGPGKDYPEYVCPVTVCLSFLTSLLIGPKLRDWRLTGNHRLGHSFALQNVIGAKNANQFIET